MDRLRTWVLLTAVAALAVLAAGWTVLVSPERSEAAALREQVASQESLNAQAETRLQVLRDKAAALPGQQAELARVSAKIPTEPDLPGVIRALTAAATEAGVELISVTPGTPTAVGAAGTAAAPAPAAGTGATPATPAPAAPGAAPGAITAVPLSLSVSGTYYETEAFVAELEDLPRALRVTSLTLSPAQGTTASSAGTVLTTSLSGVVYARGGAAAPAATAGAAAATTGTGTAPAPAVTTEQPPAATS